MPEDRTVLKIGVLPGDDMGPEVVPEAVKVMRATATKTGLEVEWSDHPIGEMRSLRRCDAVVEG